MQTNEKSKKAIKNNGIPRRTRQKAQQADTPGEYPMMLHLKKGVLSAQRDTRKELAYKEKKAQGVRYTRGFIDIRYCLVFCG